MWPHEYVITLLTISWVSWGLVAIASGLILWDMHRTEPIPPAVPQYLYDHATGTYVCIPWT